MQIKGLQKLTLLDYPERTACTVFLGGCNLRCPFCHNASLVLPERLGESIPKDNFFAFLRSRIGKIEGVCISGGEPTLWRELPEFIKEISKFKGMPVCAPQNPFKTSVTSYSKLPLPCVIARRTVG